MNKIIFILALIIFIPLNVFAQDYVIGGGDSLQISIWGSPELSSLAIVRPDGKISMPAIGELNVSGLTTSELTKVLEKEMAKVIKTPIVTVIMKNMTNFQIFILGRGVHAGITILTRQTTLLEFLANLESLENADLVSSYLVRKSKIIKKDFYALIEEGDLSQDIILEPNDILFIPDIFKNRIRVIGAVRQPQTITYRKGVTVLDIILYAGGFTEFAKENDLKIFRKNQDGEITILSVNAKNLMKGDLSENILIMPGDVVVAKESLF